MKAREKPQSEKTEMKNALRENVKTFIWAAIIAVLIRSLLFQPFNIPSSSMKPTLLIGDFLFVTKFSYGYSRHSFPFSPNLFSGRVVADVPERGDVVVFKLPVDNRTDFIKRVIGLPGDTVQMRDGALWINGSPVAREEVAEFVDYDPGLGDRAIRQYRETLPNGVTYYTLDQIVDGPADDTGIFTVPTGHYFMMGDNRDNSSDSRFSSYVGYVPHENLVGPARVLFFSFDDRYSMLQFWRWPVAIRYSRLLDAVN